MSREVIIGLVLWATIQIFAGVWFSSDLSARVRSLEEDKTEMRASTKLLNDLDARTRVIEVLIRNAIYATGERGRQDG